MLYSNFRQGFVTGYLNCNGSSTKTGVLNRRRESTPQYYWKLCFGKCRGEELYNIQKDPACMNNLPADQELDKTKNRLRDQLFSKLKEQCDPCLLGYGEVFDEYEYAGEIHRNYYERYMNGKDIEAGWMNESDFRVSRAEWRKRE